MAGLDTSARGLRIRDGARRRRVVRLEHAGSTSVPGLAAKPIIDIVLVVADSADEPAYVPDLEAAGYVLVHPRAGVVRAPGASRGRIRT